MENQLTFKQILEMSVRFLIYSTVFNIVTSVVVSLIFSGSVSVTQVADNLGFLILLEVMVFFLVGGFVDISHSAKWSATMKILKFRDKAWTMNESLSAERRALVYILTGVFLVAELLLLSLLGILVSKK